jgi:hypothetical protein
VPGNSLVLDYLAPGVASPPPPTGGGAAVGGGTTAVSPTTATNGNPVGSAPISGVHNTMLHCAMWGILGLVGIYVLHANGFHLLSVGRYGGGR